jgi:site-specific recombinase XerD
MLPASASAPRCDSRGRRPPSEVLGGYRHALTSRGAGNRSFLSAARGFLARWPDPQAWAREPLAVRLSAGNSVRPFLNYLMLSGQLHPGYDYLLARKLAAVLREASDGPLGADRASFLVAAAELGYLPRVAAGLCSQIAMRLLIQAGRPLTELTDADLAAFDAAITEREVVAGRRLKHYRDALHTSRTVIYHMGAPVTPAATKQTGHLRWPWARHFDGAAPGIGRSLTAYLECAAATRTRSTLLGIAGRLAHFARFLADADPALASLAGLDRQRHIEPYLAAVAAASNPRTGTALSASERRSRILTVGRMIDDIIEWGWKEAPPRRLIFARDIPRLPRALPRYLPPDADRALAAALHASPHRLRADALLLLRATGMRIGELLDLELDCVHEIPGAGAWLKVPLGKLDTERMVPIDDDTLALIDRITEHRSPGRPLPHPRTGKLADFLLTHQGRRVSAHTLRGELHRAAAQAGIGPATPHQLRHSYATALVNSGVSLQALMALLGHVSAEMSLRYGRLFDATIRGEYERALAQAKAQLGPVLPGERTQLPLAITGGNWRDAPLVKARLAGGYCLRTAAQGSCAYANICEHCPNFRSGASFLPVLQLQRVDAEALAADAQARGWGDEAARHRRLIERLDLLINQANAS